MTSTEHPTTQEVARIEFNGAQLLAQKIGNDMYAALKPICEGMGIEYTSQYRRLQRQPWAVVAMMTTTGADGKQYRMFAVNRKTLTMWLATIDTSRLKDKRVRETVAIYQNECAEALDKYFSEGVAIRENPNETDTELIARAVLAANKIIEQRNQRIRALETTVATQAPKAKFADAYVASDTSIPMGDMAKILKQNGVDIGRSRLFVTLHNWGLLMRSGKNNHMPPSVP